MAASDRRVKAGGLMCVRNLLLMGVMSTPDRPGIAAAVFQTLGEAHLNVQFIVQGTDLRGHAHMQFCVANEDAECIVEMLEPVASRLGAECVRSSAPVALLSVFGPDFRERPGIAGTAFGALASSGINILAVSTSISTVTCIVDDDDYEQATQALHGVFDMP